MKHTNIRITAMALALTMSGYVIAGGYVGAGIGQTNVDACSDLYAAGATTCDDEDTGFKFFGGYDINKNFAIEAGYTDAGEVSASGGGGTATAELTALSLYGKGTVPLNETFSLFGKVGLASWEADLSATGYGSLGSEDGTDLAIGIGGEFNVNNTFGVRAEWERVDADDVDVDMLSISAVMKF